MRKYFIGLLSVFLVLASILGLQTKGTKDQRSGRSGRGADPSMWV